MRSVSIGFSMEFWGGDGVRYPPPPVGPLKIEKIDVMCREKKKSGALRRVLEEYQHEFSNIWK